MIVNWEEIEKLLPAHDDLGELVITGLNRYKNNEYEYEIYRETTCYWDDKDQKQYTKELENTWFTHVSGSYPNSSWGVTRTVEVKV